MQRVHRGGTDKAVQRDVNSREAATLQAQTVAPVLLNDVRRQTLKLTQNKLHRKQQHDVTQINLLLGFSSILRSVFTGFHWLRRQRIDSLALFALHSLSYSRRFISVVRDNFGFFYTPTDDAAFAFTLFNRQFDEEVKKVFSKQQ